MSEKMGQICSNSEFCPICKKGAALGRRQMSEKMGHEPDDGTNFGSHAFPAFNSHFGQTKFLAIYPASCNVN
ncbi:MAG: hypothetical protein J6Y21_06565, partial [Clostridia bacterium]|nr:hypothetical protein [Clostridia bacterium]